MKHLNMQALANPPTLSLWTW